MGLILVSAGGAWFLGTYVLRVVHYVSNRSSRKRRLRAPELRTALLAMRGELDSANRLLERVVQKKAYWNPDNEHLPAEAWREFREVLSRYHTDLPHTYDLIEDAYQECNQLNNRVREQIEEERGQMEADAGFTMDERDDQIVQATHAKVVAAIREINERLEKL